MLKIQVGVSAGPGADAKACCPIVVKCTLFVKKWVGVVFFLVSRVLLRLIIEDKILVAQEYEYLSDAPPSMQRKLEGVIMFPVLIILDDGVPRELIIGGARITPEMKSRPNLIIVNQKQKLTIK
ncbi:MAG: hypothetical protein ABII21_00990 [bacterium]